MTWIGIVLLIFVYLIVGGIVGVVLCEGEGALFFEDAVPACVLAWPIFLILLMGECIGIFILNISRAIVKLFKSIKWCSKEEVEDEIYDKVACEFVDLKKVKETYYNSGLVMSEFLRSYSGLTVEQKRELLQWSGEDIFMRVLDDGEIVRKDE